MLYLISHPAERRVANHFAVVCALFLGSLLLGMAGYAHFEGLAGRDAFLNAAMILGGMGPVHAPLTPGGKVFAGAPAHGHFPCATPHARASRRRLLPCPEHSLPLGLDAPYDGLWQ